MSRADDIKKYSTIANIIRDLISDVRTAERDNMLDYAAKCRADIAILWPARVNAQLNSYGWPVLL